MTNFIEQSWVVHTKGKYPREFASPYRLRNPITNDESLIRLIEAYTPAHNCFCSVYSFDKWERIQKKNKTILAYENAIIDTIFIDLDSKTLPYAHYEAKLLDLYLHYHDCTPRQNFTGNKGFAFYIDFPEVKLNKKTVKTVIRKYLESIQSILSLRSIDRVCFDSISRISRLPNTINHKSGNYCIPLSREELWLPTEEIIQMAQKPSKTPAIVNECNKIPGILLAIEQDILAQHKIIPNVAPKNTGKAQKKSNENSNDTQSTSLCPGIMHIINGAQKGQRDNSLCAMICALNLQLGKNKDEILKITKGWIDSCSPPINLNDSELSNKVDYLVDSDYRPCTFTIRTGNKICKKCSVNSRF